MLKSRSRRSVRRVPGPVAAELLDEKRRDEGEQRRDEKMNRHDEQTGVAMTYRGFEEYRRMFALEPETLAAGELLDAAAGASSFTAEASAAGYRAHAVDPRYTLEPGQLTAEAAAEIETRRAVRLRVSSRRDPGAAARHVRGRRAADLPARIAAVRALRRAGPAGRRACAGGGAGRARAVAAAVHSGLHAPASAD